MHPVFVFAFDTFHRFVLKLFGNWTAVIGDKPPLTTQSCFLVGNHTTLWEAPVIHTALRDVSILPYTLMKRELLFYPLLGGFIIFPSYGHYINRAKTTTIRRLPKKAASILKKRHIMFFPEGTRTTFDAPTQCKSLLFFLAQANPNVPIVPFIHTTHTIVKKRAFWPHIKGPIFINFLEPITFDPKMSAREFLDIVNQRMDQGKKETIAKWHEFLKTKQRP